MKFKTRLLCIMSAFLLCGTVGCAQASKPPQPEPVRKQLSLSVGDSYDFSAMELSVEKAEGECVQEAGDVITAVAAGNSVVTAKGSDEAFYRYEVTVYETARELGGGFSLDRGMFAGKKVIVFGDSITDGYMGNETNYRDTYFAKLCAYLGASNDPTDLRNSNFACGGTTLTYGLRAWFGMSGVERVSMTDPFKDTGRERDPYPNVLDASLCVIFYGTNDFDENVKKSSKRGASAVDEPTNAQQAVTIKGGVYYMINKLYELNSHIKILILPPLYRRAMGNLSYGKDDPDDVFNKMTGEKLSEYGTVLRETAEEQGAKFIDWYPVFNYENFAQSETYTADGLHPNRAGHDLMFRYLIENI